MTHDTPARLLIFEPDPRGHALEWLQHLVRYASGRPSFRLSLAVPDPLARDIRTWMVATGIGDAAELRPLTPREFELCMDRRLAVSGLARWWTMRRHLKESDAAEGLFLGIDHLSLPLAAGLGFGGRKVSGILFRPSVHYGPGDTPRHPRQRARERIRDMRKRLLYRAMLRNPAVETVFSLDPWFPAHGAARYGRGDKLRPLADPASPPAKAEAADVARNPFPHGRMAFLLFGVLTERKGLLVLLEALMRLPPEIARQMAVAIAGKIEPGLLTAVAARKTALARAQPELWLRIDDRHQTNEELSTLTQCCDVVLAPYQRFVGSSGIAVRAATAGKPLITQDYGLLRKQTEDYRLGAVCDTTDADALASAIGDAVRAGHGMLGDPAGIARFLAGRTPDDFAGHLLEPFIYRNTGTAAARPADAAEIPAMDWSRARPTRSHR